MKQYPNSLHLKGNYLSSPLLLHKPRRRGLLYNVEFIYRVEIISPYGEYVINEEGVAYSEIDPNQFLDAMHMIDCTGHYVRPHVTRLVLSQEKYPAFNTSEQLFIKLSIEDEERLKWNYAVE